jgi:energy-converting hydrogenase Eha subunit C
MDPLSLIAIALMVVGGLGVILTLAHAFDPTDDDPYNF